MMQSIEAQYTLTPEDLRQIKSVEIEPDDNIINTNKMGELKGLTKEQVQRCLGFAPNIKDDPEKVENSWAFTVNGYPCAIWDWKGSHNFKRWSYYDPHGMLSLLFKTEHIEEGF